MRRGADEPIGLFSKRRSFGRAIRAQLVPTIYYFARQGPAIWRRCSRGKKAKYLREVLPEFESATSRVNALFEIREDGHPREQARRASILNGRRRGVS